MSESLRLIEKYPNRRLYGTRTSVYITLDDVKSLVLSGVGFKVVDAKSDVDLTRSILLQILIEEGSARLSLFTEDLLTQMIRFSGPAMRGMLGKYFELNMNSFSDFQNKLQDQSQLIYGENSSQMQSDMWSQFMSFRIPAMQTMMNTYMKQSREMAHQMQTQLKNQTQHMFFGIQVPSVHAAAEKRTNNSGN